MPIPYLDIVLLGVMLVSGLLALVRGYMREVLSIVGVARQTLYQWMARDAFPRPLKLSGSAIAWRESEVRDWLNSRPRALGGAVTARGCSPSP